MAETAVRTFAKVKSSAKMARQPDVPKVIFAKMKSPLIQI
jgi:hypothetical protein